MRWSDHLENNPAVLIGRPIIRGTQLAVDFVVERVARGVSEAQLLAEHPRLTHESILACLQYAAQVAKADRVYALAAD